MGISNCTNPSNFLEKKEKVVSVEGGCVSGPKREDKHDCTTFQSSGTTICTCNENLCNGVDLGTTTTTQKTNGLERLEVAIIETLVFIVLVSFLFH